MLVKARAAVPRGGPDTIVVFFSGILCNCLASWRTSDNVKRSRTRILLFLNHYYFGLLYCCKKFLLRRRQWTKPFQSSHSCLDVSQGTAKHSSGNCQNTVAQAESDGLFHEPHKGAFLIEDVWDCFIPCSRQAPSLSVYTK